MNGSNYSNCIRLAILVVVLMMMEVHSPASAGHQPMKPGPQHKCPVCGMFVAKYPDWTAEIIFEDGTIAFFDGAKDLFKYYFNLDKYAPGKTSGDIGPIYVTDYYDMELIDARAAYFVIGSDVYGPMGHELIPFKNQADAEAFKADHGGRRIVRFQRVKPALIKKMDP